MMSLYLQLIQFKSLETFSLYKKHIIIYESNTILQVGDNLPDDDPMDFFSIEDTSHLQKIIIPKNDLILN
jgi:hypothetical protein